MIISPLKMSEIAKNAFNMALEGNFNDLKKAIATNFNLELYDEEGNSILHYAVLGSNIEIVKYLVNLCGLSPLWANKQMVTPFDLAKQKNFKEIECFFEQVCDFKLNDAYRNPIIRGMYPDPSIVCVNDDYYMVNSSFIFFPCIPISHSKDLINWEIIGYAVTDAKWADENLGHLQSGRGFWAPDISYYNGRFYICATLRMNDDAPYIQTQIVTSSENPQGPYEIPTIHNVLGIDPSIFTDDDGKRYMLINRGAHIMEISQDGKQILSKPELIWYGWDKHAPEGPHLIKKDGYYYIFLAEGGTGKGHKITVARSKSLKGVYEPCPYNPIMTQRDTASPIQCCGHGKPFKTHDGRWFIVYLCSRHIDDKWDMLGRETCLDEITWTCDDWPIINNGQGPSYLAKKPFDEVKVEHISPWIAPRTISKDNISINENHIEIKGDGRDLNDKNCKSLILKRQPEFVFETEFIIKLNSDLLNDDTGLTLYYDENTFIKFGISNQVVFVKEYIDDKYTREIKKVIKNKQIYKMKIQTENLTRRFYLDDELLFKLDDVTCICSEGLKKGKRFTGATYGVYVNGTQTVKFELIR